MPFLAPPALPAPAPACRAAQLRLSASGGDGAFDGMSHSGVELTVRNLGADCVLPALPTVELRDGRGRPISAVRRPPVGMHPGPVMIPVRLGADRTATADLRWVSGPVYPDSRSVPAAVVVVRVAGARLSTRLDAVLYGQAGSPVTFEQTPLRRTEDAAPG